VVIMAWSDTVALRRSLASVMDSTGPSATVDTDSTVSSDARETKMWSMSSLRPSKTGWPAAPQAAAWRG
jgi:hypothetical protein